MLTLAFAATMSSGLGLAAMIVFCRSTAARWPVAPLAALVVSGGAAASGALVFGQATDGMRLFLILSVPLLVLQVAFRSIRWPARLLLGSLIVTSGVYLTTLVRLTFFGSLPLLGQGLSTVLLMLEAVAIILSIVFAYEMADALGRLAVDPVYPAAAAGYRPKVCLQVPA